MAENSAIAAWVFLRDLDKTRWAKSAGGSIVAAHQGQGIEQVYVPGLLFRFSRVADALRAALRLQGELNWETIFGSAPAIAIDLTDDPKRLPVLAFDLAGGSTLITQAAGRMVAAEPIDLTRGPTISFEGGQAVQTNLIAPTTQNMGWALPAMDLGARPVFQNPRTMTPPPVINIEMKRSGMDWLQYVPWKLLTIFFVGGMALIFIYASTLQVTKEMRRAAKDIEAVEPDPMDPRAGQVSIFKKLIGIFDKETPTPAPETQTDAMAAVEATPTDSEDLGTTPTEVPMGYGKVVIEIEPKDAKVFLNGKLIAKKSPVVLEKQSNKALYELKISKRNYETYVNFFNVEADQEKRISVRLAKK